MNEQSDSLVLIAWDTDFFGKRIARLYYPRAFTDVNEFDSECARQRYEWVHACINNDDEGNAAKLRELGFELADLKLTMTCHVTSQHRNITHSNNIRRSNEADIAELLSICHGSFNATSRYNWKNMLSQEQIARFYDLWLENGVRGKHDDFCFHYEEDGHILGYSTLKHNENELVIGMTAVHKNARGKGVADRLMEYILSYADKQGFHTISTVILGKNNPILHLHNKHGLFTTLTECWYYKVTGLNA